MTGSRTASAGARPRMLPRRRRLVTAVAAGVVLVLGMPLTSAAAWSTSATPLTASLTAGPVPVAPSFTCTSTPNGTTPYVTLSWAAAPVTPSADVVGYEVWVRSADGRTRKMLTRSNPAARTQEIRASLSDLLGGLTDLLLGGSPLYAEVVTVHVSGWKSAPTAGKPFVRTGLLPGLLGGLKCQ